jgi:hypothetical protein
MRQWTLKKNQVGLLRTRCCGAAEAAQIIADPRRFSPIAYQWNRG